MKNISLLLTVLFSANIAQACTSSWYLRAFWVFLAETALHVLLLVIAVSIVLGFLLYVFKKKALQLKDVEPIEKQEHLLKLRRRFGIVLLGEGAVLFVLYILTIVFAVHSVDPVPEARYFISDETLYYGLPDKVDHAREVPAYRGVGEGLVPVKIDTASFVDLPGDGARDKNYDYTEEWWFSSCTPKTIRRLIVNEADGAGTDDASGSYSSFTIDGGDVIVRGTIVVGADPSSFTDLGHGFYRDGSYIYGTGMGGSVSKLLEADRDSFISLGAGYGKDKQSVFFSNEKLTISYDLETFRVINRVAKDKNHVFYGPVHIVGADVESYRVLDRWYAVDDGAVYFHGVKVEAADPSSFVSNGEGYGTDVNHTWYLGEIANHSS